MNRAQKNAWFGLINCLLAFAFCVFFVLMFTAVPEPGFKSQPQPSQTAIFVKMLLRLWPVVLPIIALILLLIPRRKQSPAEPDFDELDRAIQHKAIQAAFISIWFLWPLGIILIMLRIGLVGNLPIICYFSIYWYVFMICMTIYFLTKVLLYRKHIQGEAG
ncbi:MAG: hypothetical protein JW795_13125 [Chitinivibrionales bacterium]|nr:hypothetical protein [Chitinivibrionales bacterium]